MKASYDGYSACPIYVGENKLILAEFLYDGKVKFFIFYIIFLALRNFLEVIRLTKLFIIFVKKIRVFICIYETCAKRYVVWKKLYYQTKLLNSNK